MRFLREYSRSCNVTDACRKAGCHRDAPYKARDKSPQFAKRWKQAEERVADKIRKEYHRRAVEGWDEEVYGKMGQIGTIRRYDSVLLQKLAVARCPELRAAEKATSGGTTKNVLNLTVNITPEQLTGLQDRRRLALEQLN